MLFTIELFLPNNQSLNLQAEGVNWLFALQDALEKEGYRFETNKISCQILAPNEIKIVDKQGRTFIIKGEAAFDEVQPPRAETALSPDKTEAIAVPTQDDIPFSQPTPIEPTTPAPQPDNSAPAPLPTAELSAEMPPASPEDDAPYQLPDKTVGVQIPAPPAENLSPPTESTPLSDSPEDTPYQLGGDDQPLPTVEAQTFSEPLPPQNTDNYVPDTRKTIVEDELPLNDEMIFTEPVPVVDRGSEPPTVEPAPQFSPSPTPAPEPPPAEPPTDFSPQPQIEQLAVTEPPVASEPTAEIQADPASAYQAPSPLQPPTQQITEEKPAKLEEKKESSGFSPLLIQTPGKYSPGMTTELLAGVFMEVMDIYSYEDDKKGAMEFIMKLAMENTNAIGGGILLTDINTLSQELWFEVATGPHSEELLNLRIPIGTGVIGFCAKNSVSKLLEDLSSDPQFKDDPLLEMGIPVGSVLCSPIQKNNQMFGVIFVYNQKGSPPLTSSELGILNYLGQSTAEYLEKF